jgi:hypothetical protein
MEDDRLALIELSPAETMVVVYRVKKRLKTISTIETIYHDKSGEMDKLEMISNAWLSQLDGPTLETKIKVITKKFGKKWP